MPNGRARRCARIRQGVRAEARRATFSASSASIRHDEAASEEIAKQAHDLYRAFLRQGARPARPELSAAGPLPVSGHSRRGALSLVRAARRRGRRRRLRPAHARRADGRSASRSTSARWSSASTRTISATIRARSCWSTCCARCSPAATPSRIRGSRSTPSCESFRYGHGGILSKLLFGSAHRQGAVRRHQGRPRARHPARPSRGAAAQHGGVPGARGAAAAMRSIDVTALASVISTAEDSQEIDGQRVQVVVGRPVGSAQAGEILRRQRADPAAAAGRLGLAVPQRAGVRAARRSIRRRSMAFRTSISTARSNF